MNKKLLWYVALGDLNKPFMAATIHSREDVRGLSARGWNAVLVSQSNEPPTEPSQNEWIVCKNRPVYYRLLFELKIIWRLLTSRKKPAFVLFRGTALLLVGLMLKLLGIPFGVELPGPSPYCIEKKRWWKWRHRSDLFFLKRSELFIALNRELADIADTYKKKQALVAVTGVGVNAGDYQIPARSNSNEQTLILGFLGVLYLDRGLGSIIESLAALVQKNIDAYLVIVGDGPARPMAEQKVTDLGIADRVTFKGFVPPDQVGSALVDTDLMIAIYEQTPELVVGGINPMKVWTSLSLARPVLLFNPGKYNAYEKVPGILMCPATDPEILAQTIELHWIQQGKTGLADQGQKGRNFVEQSVTWQKHADVIHDTIQTYFDQKDSPQCE
jgi:glycosyltransferase involved in cell wall biosynthesis